MAATDNIVYHGNCHCGRYRFQVSTAEITSAISCSCSLCVKKGYLWLIPGEGSFTVVRDEGYLVEYQTSTLKDKVYTHAHLSSLRYSILLYDQKHTDSL